MSVVLTNITYGKSRVRLTKVQRGADKHSVKEINLDISLEGTFEDSYTHGDNRLVIATDSMKNTVYVFARDHALDSIESFARDLAAHFLAKYGHVTAVTVRVVERPWERLTPGGSFHPHSFLSPGGERRTTTVIEERQTGTHISSGLDGLVVLKTADSSFAGFLRDEYTTLEDTDVRLLSTVVEAEWKYGLDRADWISCRETVRTALLETFAAHESRSLQQTFYLLGRAALAACREVDEIRMTMPNKHQILVDLSPFGLDNEGEIFVPTEEPYGLITGTLKRQ